LHRERTRGAHRRTACAELPYGAMVSLHGRAWLVLDAACARGRTAATRTIRRGRPNTSPCSRRPRRSPRCAPAGARPCTQARDPNAHPPAVRVVCMSLISAPSAPALRAVVVGRPERLARRG
jgi:hypothetical protein